MADGAWTGLEEVAKVIWCSILQHAFGMDLSRHSENGVMDMGKASRSAILIFSLDEESRKFKFCGSLWHIHSLTRDWLPQTTAHTSCKCWHWVVAVDILIVVHDANKIAFAW